MANKGELVRFLDERVFDPILKASDRDYGEERKKELEEVQNKRRTEKDRYHHYPSAEKVIEMYKADLSSDNARRVNKNLKRLGLPILADVKEEFEKLAG